ncbi:hypothetical protein PFLU4_19820 [Pseudomonas fluorescens]|nr:hypothetical protein PFLU4_19820 [Pseudomonas fluorescens]
MKTSLHFEAPNDLSVGTVRIKGAGDIIADWVATPDNRTFLQSDLKPGIYSAEISPAGVSPQSVIFEVREGQANNVVLPSFSALSSSGSNTSFFDTDNQQTVAQVPDSMSLNMLEKLEMPAHQSEAFSGTIGEQTLDSKRSQKIDISREKKRISIGLSEEKNGRETFDTFRGQSSMELFSGRLEIEIPTDLSRNHWAGHRVRLSAAIEKVRVERCLLPLYCGGTKITIAAPPFSPSDLELNIMPVDPKLRALLRALDAGTSAEVSAVRDNVLGKADPAALLDDLADPWAAMLAGLLAVRFPDIFQPIDSGWAEKLVERASWAFDAYVIRANQVLSVARTSPDAQDEAVVNAATFLAKAQVAGSPYYRYSNQLFTEMVVGIADYLKMNAPRVDPAAVRRFDRLYGRWQRELALQRGAGSTFTWLARDPAALKENRVLVPYRGSSGKLRQKDCTIIFEGQLGAGQIAIIGGGPNTFRPLMNEGNTLSTTVESKYDFSQMPALTRAPGPNDDPNKGRFGGQASHSGFTLTAAFEPTKNRDLITIILTLEAERSAKLGLGDFAWFVLHPTFSPSALKVTFRGRRAQLRIQVWGGFTVGVWLPKAGLEFECNLAQIEEAPYIIKTR